MNSYWPAVALTALVLIWCFFRKPRSVRIITVIDGDTCMSVDKRGVKRKLRIHGVDAPETGQRMGAEAKAFLVQELQGQWCRVKWRGRDKYKRHLVRIRGVSGTDVSVGLVRRGLAYPMAGTGLSLHSFLARITFRGVWLTGAKPHDSLKRRFRLLGWASWKLDTAKQRKRSRQKARPR